MAYYTYILYSKSADRYYIGYTSDITSRVDKHNAGSTQSTKHGIPWLVAYYEEFESKSEAIKREKYLERMKSRKFIEELISGRRSSR